jgi:adenylylsulfate kinase
MIKVPSNIKPCVVFLTGFSGAGKTTIALALTNELKKKELLPVLLDGDEVRAAIQLTAFDEGARKQHNRSVGALAALLEAQGHIVIVALIAPYSDVRNEIRKDCQRFIEVYVSTEIDTCIQRDTKGLYKKALAGEIKNFTGISAPYEPPANAEVTTNTAVHSLQESVLLILKAITHE